MESPRLIPGSALSSNDENQRVKFLCSFSGSILPRPQDGKLRYVGGETRIVSVARDITYEELMVKMRELYEGVTVLKYQQPDEDLDALVSVVNDDDVTNMMEEYDKLGSENGFTRLRIFLFTHLDQDGSLHFGDGGERDNERRYVDALNSLNESPDSRKQHGESLLVVPPDDIHVADQYFSPMNLEGSLHGQRNMELPMAQMNLRHLNIPHVGSTPLQQRYSEMEAPWSPAYYSPRQAEQRLVGEFQTSPSSAHYRTLYGDYSDKVYEDYNSPHINTQQQQYPENVVLIPAATPVGNDQPGFPNILQASSVYEGNSICEHCRMAFQRNQTYPESSWNPGDQTPHLEAPNLGNGYHQVPNSCAECSSNRERYMSNSDGNMNSPFYCRDHERGWASPHQPNRWPEELRPHLPVSVSGRLADSYVMENGMNIPVGHGNVCDGHHMQAHYIHHDDQRHARPGVDYGNQVFQDQTVPQVHPQYAYGNESVYQAPHGHIAPQAQWINIHSPMQGVPSYETHVSSQIVNGSVPMGFIRGAVEGSPRVRTGVENQSPWGGETSQKIMGFDGSPMPEYSHIQAVKFSPNTHSLENRPPGNMESIHAAAVLPKPAMSSDLFPVVDMAPLVNNTTVPVSVAASGIDLVNGNGAFEGSKEKNVGVVANSSCVCGAYGKNSNVVMPSVIISSDTENDIAVNGNGIKASNHQLSDDQLEFLPELLETVKEAALSSLGELKIKAGEDSNLGMELDIAEKDIPIHKDGAEGNIELEVESDIDNVDHSKIELTKAEAEAIDRGLQTIRNEDLEEIRELGSGTYGSVFHGKWRGSDVAIKRIKASCFAGRPSERERLIADFWKEALILSSLHHPNVVSFYGVVRDGPDGSLATVTEFMVNGSLKQFIQKKDRTIDRRKRLLIAMDAAFGMEYLHEKNIVHFDLKCENLLVNMKDPHRPVCKIGDLGLSKVKQHTLVSGGVRGTLPWMAPELLSGKSKMVTDKIDVYSFGIVMWELLTGDEPYTDMHCASIIGGIVNNTLRPEIPTWCDPEWKSLMESCWDADQASRPSFAEIAQRLRNMAAAMNLK